MLKLGRKKAWVKIVEAIIAIFLLAGIVLLLYTQFKPVLRTDRIQEFERAILEDISMNDDYRQNVLDENEDILSNYAREKLARSFPGLNCTIKICDIEEICPSPYYDREVYSSERIIATTLQEYFPKKIKIFVWREI